MWRGVGGICRCKDCGDTTLVSAQERGRLSVVGPREGKKNGAYGAVGSKLDPALFGTRGKVNLVFRVSFFQCYPESSGPGIVNPLRVETETVAFSEFGFGPTYTHPP